MVRPEDAQGSGSAQTQNVCHAEGQLLSLGRDQDLDGEAGLGDSVPERLRVKVEQLLLLSLPRLLKPWEASLQRFGDGL